MRMRSFQRDRKRRRRKQRCNRYILHSRWRSFGSCEELLVVTFQVSNVLKGSGDNLRLAWRLLWIPQGRDDFAHLKHWGEKIETKQQVIFKKEKTDERREGGKHERSERINGGKRKKLVTSSIERAMPFLRARSFKRFSWSFSSRALWS